MTSTEIVLAFGFFYLFVIIIETKNDNKKNSFPIFEPKKHFKSRQKIQTKINKKSNP